MRDSKHPGKLRVGIVGTGWVATARNIPAFKRDRRATVTAVYDRDPGKAEQTARRLRIPLHFASIDSLLEQPLDVVSVCTPPQTHAPIIEACIRSGKHVFVEKPMALTSGEGRSMESLAAEAGVLLCPAHNFLFSQSVQKADSLLPEAGGVGDIEWAMGIQFSSWRRRLPTWYGELHGGLFFDEAPHMLSLMQHFLSEVRVEDAWQTAAERGGQRSERIEARLAGVRGTGYLTMWTGAPFSEWLFVLGCSRAVLVIDLYRDLLMRLPPERAHTATDVLKFSARGTLGFWQGIGRSALRAIRGRFLFGHDVLASRFVDAVIEGQPSPVPAREGWEVISLIEQILDRSERAV